MFKLGVLGRSTRPCREIGLTICKLVRYFLERKVPVKNVYGERNDWMGKSKEIGILERLEIFMG